MQATPLRRYLAVAVLSVVAVAVVNASEIHSSPRSKISAVVESNGFSVQPVYDVQPNQTMSDLAVPQVFEIVRPMDKPVTIGRMFTSCSCVQLETSQRIFRPGERALLVLRNIKPTPGEGMMYALFVQITSPVRTTLRVDTFVQTGAGPAPVTTPTPAATPASAPPPDGTGGQNSDLAAALTAVGSQAGEGGAESGASDMAGGAGAGGMTEPLSLLPNESEVLAALGDLPGDGGGASTSAEDLARELQSGAAAAQRSAEGSSGDASELSADLGAGLPDFSDASRGVRAAAPASPSPARDPDAPRRPVQLIGLITIGVRDMEAAVRFYEALGWQRAARGKYDRTAFFQLHGQVLALYPMNDLLREQNMVGALPQPGGITLALHVRDKADVWEIYQRFIDAGGQSLRSPAEMASGIVSSYVADPDGNPWEISWVPQFRIDENGGLWLP